MIKNIIKRRTGNTYFLLNKCKGSDILVLDDKTIKQYDGQYWKKVKRGMLVDAEIKGELKRVLVNKVITRKLYHPQGIEIETINKEKGRVKNIIKQVFDDIVVLKGDFNTLNKLIFQLEKYSINIKVKNKDLEWIHINNPMANNTIVQVLLGDSINRMNYKISYNPPYAIFFIRKKEIIGIEYYDYYGNLQFDLKNTELF